VYAGPASVNSKRFVAMNTTNALKTVFLLGLLSALLLVGGELIAGRQGLYFGLFLAVAMNFAGYFFSDKLALKMYRAKQVTPESYPRIYSRIAPMTENLTRRMNIPMPKLWVIPDESPNAFATGRNPKHASVAVTEGILRLMEDNEIEGVIAHELAHVRNRDILISSIAATIAAAILFISRMAMYASMFGGSGGSRDGENRGGAIGMIAMLILGPIAAMMIQMAISRTREFAADATAAKYHGTPYGLASALQKLETYSKRIPMDASPATAHMFIIKPFAGSGVMSRLFSTHPSTEQRIARLMAIR
jgi:heat shock protein HtpX